MKSCFIFQVRFGLTVSLPDSELPDESHCLKCVKIWSFSGPCFLKFGLNAEIYKLNLRIQSKYGKIQTRKFPYLETFSAVHQMNKDIRILGN